jgi:hypothetical protein
MNTLEVNGITDSTKTIIILEKIDSVSMCLGKHPFIRIMINGMPHMIDYNNEEAAVIVYEGIKKLLMEVNSSEQI